MLVKFELDVPAEKLVDIMAVITGKAAAPAPLPVVATAVKVNPTIQPNAIGPTIQPNAIGPTIQPVPAPKPTPTPVVVKPSPVVLAAEPEPVVAPAVDMNAMLGMDNPTAEQHTVDDIRGLVMQIAPEKRVSLMQDIFNRLGVQKLSDIPADKLSYAYNAFHQFFE